MKRGERIKDYRVKIEKSIFNKILLENKKELKLTWNEYARKLEVSIHTLKNDWRNESTIPLNKFKNILEDNPFIKWEDIKDKVKILEPFWGQKIGKKSQLREIIKIPPTETIEFAEFYGALLGDGCVYNNLSGFCLSGDKILDKNYLGHYIPRLIKKLFNIKPKIYFSKKDNSIRCVVYSKDIAEFLINLGFPRGEKKFGKPKIHKKFYKNKGLLKACIRGINDTDGSIYPQDSSKIILDMSVTVESLTLSLDKAFRKLNILINKAPNRLYMCGSKPVSKFFNAIGSSNLKHIVKYKSFIRTGKPLNTIQTEMFLKEEKKLNLNLPYHGPVV